MSNPRPKRNIKSPWQLYNEIERQRLMSKYSNLPWNQRYVKVRRELNDGWKLAHVKAEYQEKVDQLYIDYAEKLVAWRAKQANVPSTSTAPPEPVELPAESAYELFCRDKLPELEEKYVELDDELRLTMINNELDTFWTTTEVQEEYTGKFNTQNTSFMSAEEKEIERLCEYYAQEFEDMKKKKKQRSASAPRLTVTNFNSNKSSSIIN